MKRLVLARPPAQNRLARTLGLRASPMLRTALRMTAWICAGGPKAVASQISTVPTGGGDEGGKPRFVRVWRVPGSKSINLNFSTPRQSDAR